MTDSYKWQHVLVCQADDINDGDDTITVYGPFADYEKAQAFWPQHEKDHEDDNENPEDYFHHVAQIGMPLS